MFKPYKGRDWHGFLHLTGEAVVAVVVVAVVVVVPHSMCVLSLA